jgi:PAS domain S-box-containing protein
MGSDLLRRLLHPDDKPMVQPWRRWIQTSADGTVPEHEFRLRDAAGQWHWLVSREVVFTRNAGGGPKLVLGAARDITARKEVEQEREQLMAELEHRAAELDATINSIADAVIIYGPGGEVRRMNPAASRFLGHPAAGEGRAPLGERLSSLRFVSPDGRSLPLGEAPHLLAQRGETVSGAVGRLERPGKKPRWVSASAAPIRTADGRQVGVVATFSDITALHELQEQRDVYLHMISHDLRTPLTTVHGHAQLLERALRDRGEEDGTARVSIAAIKGAVTRMNIMIGDLVDVARMEGGQLSVRRKAVRLQPFWADLAQRFGTVLDLERIRVDLPDDLPPALADGPRLERVLINLLTNAMKYSAADRPVQVRARCPGDHLVLEVADEGQGISAEDRGRIFDRFFRASTGRHAPGVGLGLYITKLLVEAQGGEIWVESEPGRGSRFVFTLEAAGTAG